MWLNLALLGYTCLAVVSILDKFILTKEKVSPAVFVFYSTFFLFPVSLLIPWLTPRPTLSSWALITIGALAFVLSLWAMYNAFQKSAISHIGPLIGAFIPIFILVLSRVFLGEQIMSTQILGIILLSIGCLLISVQKKQPHHNWSTSIKFGIASAGLFSIFHVTAKSLYSEFGFSHGFLFLWGIVGVFGLSLLSMKEVRLALFPEHRFWRGIYSKIFNHQPTPTPPKRGIEIITIVADKLLSVAGIVLVQYSVSLGSVSRVNALEGFRYGLLVILVAGLTKFWPEAFSEHYQVGEFRRELLAVFIIATGLYFLVI